ncbi:MAG: glycosyltransferase [Sulfitobacter sp.]
MTTDPVLGAVIIGRNEGGRLIRCLASVAPDVARMVYVDSGSTDGSADAARKLGAQVVDIDMTQPFTAARARNAGFAALMAAGPVEYVQFVDGDCELQPGWIAAARDFLEAHPQAAVACGRRRERFPEATVYNRLCDWEWDTALGQTKSCGGDALMRATHLDGVGGFNPAMIAGEEPELCVRLRQAGWQIWRLDHEMTLHDAAMTRFGQWWKRARRAGHAFGEGAALHGAPPERHSVDATRRILLWGVAIPAFILLAALLVTPWALLLVLLYPVQVARLARREGAGDRSSWERACLLTLGKFPEALGVLEYHWRRLLGRPAGLIEYK